MKTFFLIDGNSFCYRAFYAIRDLATSKGEPTNAVYGFLNMLRKILNERKPDYLAVAFDMPGETFRHKRYEEYKIHRKPMPDGLSAQIPKIKEALRAYKIPIFEHSGWEADDVIATIVERLKKEPVAIFIATGDKDLLQLVDDKIKVFNPQGEGEIIDASMVRERFGVEPGQIADYIALCGDATDNIPGVRGIGEKTAAKLLEQFKDIEAIYDNLEDIPSKSQRKILSDSRKSAFLSKELAKIDAQIPIDVKVEDLSVKEPDEPRLVELFKELEFRALLREIAPSGKAAVSLDITAEKELEPVLKKFSSAKGFSFCADSNGCGFAAGEKTAYYVPQNLLSGLRGIFEDDKIQKIGFDLKSQKILLGDAGINLCGPYFDVKVASYLLNPHKPNQDLQDIALDYLGTAVEESAAQTAHAAFLLCERMEKELGEKNLTKLFDEIEMPLVDVLADMEKTGVAIDAGYLKKLSEEFALRLEKVTKEIYDIAECEFNINSPKQLANVLFEKLGLPVIKRTKTGPSTDVEVLTELAAKHALPANILKYRELAKLKSAYVDALPAMVRPSTGRIHTSFNQTVTATGRLSSSEPNLQNIPIRTKEGQKIRKAFVPGRGGGFLLSADYSQVELRILAHLSKDPRLIEAFEKDKDIHAHTASLIFGVEQEKVSPQQRSNAKTVNFGIIYGMSAYGLSKELGIDTAQAEAFISAYFARYPKVREYLDREIERAREDGYVSTIFHRRRYIPEINSDNPSVRSFAERTAINAPIQGSAADMIKVAMVNIHGELTKRNLRSKMILQVHDELVFDTSEDELDAVAELVKERMENASKLAVPVKVKVSAGKNWLEMEER